MDKSELERLFQEAAKMTSFIEDKDGKNSEGCTRFLGLDQYSSKMAHGLIAGCPVTMTVGSRDFFSSEDLKLESEYGWLADKRAVLIPAIESFYFGREYRCLIRWRIAGRIFLSRPLYYTPEDRLTIASLYWNTVNIFSRMREAGSTGVTIDPKVYNFSNFFWERVNRWLKKWDDWHGVVENSAKNEQLSGYELAEYENDKYILGKMLPTLKGKGVVESINLPLEFFFKNFGVTDLVFKEEEGSRGEFYLPSAQIVSLPQFYGAAYFVWSLLMYSHDASPEVVVKEAEIWSKSFETSCPNCPNVYPDFRQGFYLNLALTAIGALLIDIPRGLSPFDRPGGIEDNKRAVRLNFWAVLWHSLDVIHSEIFEN